MIIWESSTVSSIEGIDPTPAGTLGTKVPNVVVITITNICNMRCPQCAYPQFIPKKPFHMPYSLISKIVNECAEIGVSTIRLLGLAEPTLHPSFYDILELLMQYRSLSLHVLTNGSSLTSKGVHRLLRTPPSVLEVSIDAFSYESYLLVRGGNHSLFQRVVEGTKDYAIGLRKGRDEQRWGDHYPVSRVSFVLHPETKLEVPQFAAAWVDYADEVLFRKPHNFNGFAKGLPSQAEVTESTVRSCSFIPSRLYVDVEGTIHACIDDIQNQFVLGNLHTNMSLISAWDHASRLSLLRAHASGENLPSVCITCHRRYL